MASPLISVIIPVFNAQHTLPAAIDSVFSQSIPDMEIILVNDGSRDDSLGICEQYAQKDPRIKVIDQPNGGPSAARNAGLRVAGGRYISFMDSDDTLTPGAYPRMLNAVQCGGAEMVIGHFNFMVGKKALDRGRVKKDVVLNKDAFMGALARKPASSYYACVWNKLYSRGLVEENDIFFDNTITWGEDLHFNLLCYYHVKRVAFVKEPVYNYRLTLFGQAFRSFSKHPKHVVSVRILQYHTLKDLYVRTGHYRQYRAWITRFLLDTTISQ